MYTDEFYLGNCAFHSCARQIILFTLVIRLIYLYYLVLDCNILYKILENYTGYYSL
ncbi:hypothetical protein MtrunA17_Chr8g0366901 [Medicago truncatula]|uniref:Transmembrane protein n=1 Tax=Medicago truncatula TaxID=3880 RepID=A0A396GK68_MEDTR|nr:hypothetical protein MtrunA17_Chr8g0366901 [Medicago truncatula]